MSRPLATYVNELQTELIQTKEELRLADATIDSLEKILFGVNLGRSRDQLEERAEAYKRLSEAYRVEADCAMRDYDDLELRAGYLKDALEQIAEGWAKTTIGDTNRFLRARTVAREALEEYES